MILAHIMIRTFWLLFILHSVIAIAGEKSQIPHSQNSPDQPRVKTGVPIVNNAGSDTSGTDQFAQECKDLAQGNRTIPTTSAEHEHIAALLDYQLDPRLGPSHQLSADSCRVINDVSLLEEFYNVQVKKSLNLLGVAACQIATKISKGPVDKLAELKVPELENWSDELHGQFRHNEVGGLLQSVAQLDETAYNHDYKLTPDEIKWVNDFLGKDYVKEYGNDLIRIYDVGGKDRSNPKEKQGRFHYALGEAPKPPPYSESDDLQPGVSLDDIIRRTITWAGGDIVSEAKKKEIASRVKGDRSWNRTQRTSLLAEEYSKAADKEYRRRKGAYDGRQAEFKKFRDSFFARVPADVLEPILQKLRDQRKSLLEDKDHVTKLVNETVELGAKACRDSQNSPNLISNSK